MKKLFCHLLMSVCFAGCNQQSDQPFVLDSSFETRSRTFLQNDLGVLSDTFNRQPKGIVLTSNDGAWGGIGDDVNLELHSDGTAVVAKFKVDNMLLQSGTYRVTEDGKLTVALQDGSSWLPMDMSVDKGKILVHPPVDDLMSAEARRSNRSIEEIRSQYRHWPFRQVNAD